MKAAIVSDSHDDAVNLEKAALLANLHNCGWLFHLGDVTTPAVAVRLGLFRGIVRGVFGNCDSDKPGLKRVFSNFGGDIAPSPYLFDVEGVNIVLCHEPFDVERLTAQGGHDYIFYGHLHRHDYRREGGTHIINPGAVGGGRSAHSFVIVDLAENTLERIEL